VKYLLDTDTFSAIARGAPTAVMTRLASMPTDDLALSVISLGEIAAGLAKRKPGAKQLRRIELLQSAFTPLPLTPAVVPVYASVRSHLEAKGSPIGPNDTWIAAHALEQGLTLVTNNVREFRRVPGLRVENWIAGQA
jgi:tRNA(fMet)-specific endonuclease VapC